MLSGLCLKKLMFHSFLISVLINTGLILILFKHISYNGNMQIHQDTIFFTFKQQVAYYQATLIEHLKYKSI